MKLVLKQVAAALTLCLALTGCAQSGTAGGVKLDPKHPVNVTVWHYYNGAQQVAFDQLVEQFNSTQGAQQGIFVEAHGQGNVTDLETKVLDAFNKAPGSDDPPNIFSSYADTAYAIEQLGQLVDLDQYLSEAERAAYVDSFIEEGRIGVGGELYIFPTAKSSEIFMLNKTAWDEFAAATGTDTEQLGTREGLVEVARQYYEWTDGLTPDIANDGEAFYGRDAMANLFIIGAQELGMELLSVNGQKLTLNVDEQVMRRIWDFYYVPYINGWFSAYGRFRSDDLKIGEIIAYTGSTTSGVYFPEQVETEEGSQPIDYMILAEPGFQGGRPYAVQQGAGMVVTKSTQQQEYAAVEFLKWFTQEKNNVAFACGSGYLPVKKSAVDQSLLDQVIQENNLEITSKAYDALITGFNTMKENQMYTSKAFGQGVEVRKVLEYHLADRAAADRELVEQRLMQGQSLKEATADLTTDEAFQDWLLEFKAALFAAAKL